MAYVPTMRITYSLILLHMIDQDFGLEGSSFGRFILAIQTRNSCVLMSFDISSRWVMLGKKRLFRNNMWPSLSRMVLNTRMFCSSEGLSDWQGKPCRFGFGQGGIVSERWEMIELYFC